MEHIKLIACDLDGTLLLNGAQQLRPETCGLIARLMDEKGLFFCAASGRQYANLQRLFAPVKDRIGYVCENGCLSYYQEKRIHRYLMDHELGRDILRTIMDTDGAEVLLTGERTHYIQPKDMNYFFHMRDVVRNDVTLVPDIFNTPEPYMKVSLYEKGGLHDVEWWEEQFASRCTVAIGGGEWLDMMPPGVNKASGLKHLLDHLGISPQAVMAIGDNDNDREMLEMAGLPVTVRSAKPSIRAMAKTETETVEDLFVRILLD